MSVDVDSTSRSLLDQSTKDFIKNKLVRQRENREYSFDAVSDHLQSRTFAVEQAITTDVRQMRDHTTRVREKKIREFMLVFLCIGIILVLYIVAVSLNVVSIPIGRIYVAYLAALFSLLVVLITSIMRKPYPFCSGEINML